MSAQDPLGRLMLADVLPDAAMHADYLAHVARLNAVRTVQELMAHVERAMAFSPRFVKADLRLRVPWVARAEENCGRWLLCAEGTAEKKKGRELRKWIRALRAAYALGERRDGRPRKTNAGFMAGEDCSVTSMREPARCRPQPRTRASTASEPTASTRSATAGGSACAAISFSPR